MRSLARLLAYLVCVALTVTTACKKQEIATPDYRPPPIAAGRCVVDTYVGTTATKQVCNHDGQSYSCAWAAGTHTCERKGEAAGERPPVDAGSGSSK